MGVSVSRAFGPLLSGSPLAIVGLLPDVGYTIAIEYGWLGGPMRGTEPASRGGGT